MFDTELFIAAVKKHPCLWNTTANSYANHAEKIEAWREIAKEINSDIEDDDRQKKEYVSELKKKWKNIRDCYRRENRLQKEVKSGCAAKLHKQYAFYNQLNFLAATMVTNPVEDSTGAPYKDAINFEDCSESEGKHLQENKKRRKLIAASKKFSKNRRETVDIRKKLLKTLQEHLKSNNEKQAVTDIYADDDKLFLLSLASDFKSIPIDLKLRFKADFLNKFQELVAQYQNISSSSISLFCTPKLSPEYNEVVLAAQSTQTSSACHNHSPN